MPTQVKIPDGTILQFPDGMSEQDMAAAIYKNFPQLKPATSEPAVDAEAKSIESSQKRTQLVKEMEQERFRGSVADSAAMVASFAESQAKALAHPIKTIEGGIEGAATLITGSPKVLTVKPSEIMERPLVALPKIPNQETTTGKIAAGAGNAVIDFATFMLTPEGVALLGIGGLPEASRRMATMTIAADMAAKAPAQFNAAVEAARAGDIQKAAEHTTSFLGGTALSAVAANHAISQPGVVVGNLKAAEAPLTAAAVEATAKKPVDPNWLVTVQAPQKLDATKTVPGYTQIDFIEGGQNVRSASRETLAKEGYDVPDFSSLPQGRYTMGDALRLTGLMKPDASLGIVPQGTGNTLKIVDALMPRERGTPPPINPDTTTPLPDFQPHATSKQIASEPFGSGRLPVLGPLLDPRTRIRDNVGESLSAYHYERGVGRAISSALGEQLRGTIDRHFDVDPQTSQIRNIQTTRDGQSTHVSDVFEALQKDPNSYVLTPEQRTSFERMNALNTEMRRLEDKYELFQDASGEVQSGKPTRRESYFPRIVVERPPQDVAPLKGGGMIGGKQFFQKERLFESEAEGVQKGYRYEPSIEARVVTRAERLYKAIADKRLADDPALGAKTRQNLESELREAYAEELGSGEMTDAKLTQIVDSLEKKGRVWQPAFFGKIFDAATANKLNEAFPNADSVFRRGFVSVNNALKAIRLSLDLGVGQLQGLPTLYRNPAIWGKAQWNSLKALVDPQVFPEYVRENLDAVREMAQMGSSVGRLEEMMAGMKQGELVTRVPVAGRAFEAFGRQFQTFLDTAKVELWKSWRDVTPREQWQSVMETIESQLSTGRMETIGVGRNRALVERAMLLAPSYYRGAINLVAAIGERGTSGKVARQALGAYMAGGLLTYIGIALAMDMDEKEIVERLNPARPDFLMWSMETETGRKFNAGFGGIYRSLLRLAGNVTKTSIEHPENWKSLAPDKNPFVRWYRGHAAPVPGMVWDQFSGKDFAGHETDIGTGVSSIKPMVFQQLEQKPGQPKPSAVDVGLSFLGMSAYPESLHAQFGRERDEMAQKLYQKPYDELRQSQAARVTKEVQKMPAFSVKEPPTALQRERAFKADQERIKRIEDSLSESSRAKLKTLNLKISGFEPSFTQAGTTVPLSKAQQERYEKLVVEEYEIVLGRLNTNALSKLPEKRRQQILSDRMTDAKVIARRKLFTLKPETNTNQDSPE